MPSRRNHSRVQSQGAKLPDIGHDDSFRKVTRKLSRYFEQAIELPSTFEQLRTTTVGLCLHDLVDHLTATCTNPATVNALLALKWHYALDEHQQGLGMTRSNACEIVAWRFLAGFTEKEALDFCLYELPDAHEDHNGVATPDQLGDDETGERAPLIARITNRDSPHISAPVGSTGKRTQLLSSLSHLTRYSEEGSQDDEDPTVAFERLNALEIAAIANAKKFLSQHVVQKIITGIWNGDIVFWDTLTSNATKKPRFYDPQAADPFSRLRVPKYMKCYEVIFLAIFLCLYYSVLIRGVIDHITVPEIALFCWFAAFFYDELSEWLDAGSIFYAADIWNFFDLIIAFVGFAFTILRIAGLVRHDHHLSSWAFDVLALEALFMIPRISSILSLSPYWGTLIPCLKEMGKDFVKFMVFVVIFYLGFLTTFSLIGRKVFSIPQMVLLLTKIFYGSGYLGFDVMSDIDPLFGPPLMIIFITFTNILLLGSLTGILSNSFLRVTNHAREEHLYVYAVYILEASTSNRLTHFYPPFNLLALVLFRPWALLYPKSPCVRASRIQLLKVTHLPIVAAIQVYEVLIGQQSGHYKSGFAEEPLVPTRGRKMDSSARHSRVFDQQIVGQAVRDRSQSQTADVEDTDGSGVQAQIEELHRKIDLLTQTLFMMQDKLNASDKAKD